MNAAKLYATALAVIFLVIAGPASADDVNLVPNGTFEGSVAGWRGESATLSVASPGAVGSGAAKVSLTGSATSYYLYPAPRPVSSTIAGATYTASAFVRGSFLERRLCLRLREWSPTGTQLGAFSTCLRSNGSWQKFNSISWTAKGTGNQLEVYAYGIEARAGDSFLVDEVTLTSSVATSPVAPANAVLPSVSGTARAGQTLSATTGSWSGTSPLAYSYQWLGCDSAGANCLPLAGATAATYALTSSNVGSTVRARVTASNSVGSSTATSAQSAVVAPAPLPPAATSMPAVTGTAQDGQTLTSSTGAWSGTQPITHAFQWRRCDSAGNACSAITGATAATYRAASGDVGSTLRAAVTATNAAGSSTAVSAATGVVQAAPTTPPPSGSVVWSAGMEGGNLSEWTESWDSGLCTRPPNGVSTAFAHSGRYSMAMTINTSQGDAGCRQARTTESRSGKPYYYGSWLYIPVATKATNYWNIVQFKTKRPGASGSDPFWVIDLMPRSTGALALRLRWKGMIPGPFAGDGTARRTWSQTLLDVPVGRWFHVETYLRQSGGYDGRITVWQDGVKLWDLDAVNTKYSDGDERWTVNNYSDALTPNPATLYVDDATIAEGRVYSG